MSRELFYLRQVHDSPPVSTYQDYHSNTVFEFVENPDTSDIKQATVGGIAALAGGCYVELSALFWQDRWQVVWVGQQVFTGYAFFATRRLRQHLRYLLRYRECISNERICAFKCILSIKSYQCLLKIQAECFTKLCVLHRYDIVSFRVRRDVTTWMTLSAFTPAWLNCPCLPRKWQHEKADEGDI